jgi:hypothetical protein
MPRPVFARLLAAVWLGMTLAAGACSSEPSAADRARAYELTHPKPSHRAASVAPAREAGPGAAA